MRVVLVNPPMANMLSLDAAKYVDRNRGKLPSMGLLYLQAVLKRAQHQSSFLDAHLEGWSHGETARQVLRWAPELVGIQATSFTLVDAYLTARAIKALDPRIKTLFGGPHPTLYPEETAFLEPVDFVLAGEAEDSLVEFLEVFPDLDRLARVPGAAVKIDHRVAYLPPRPPPAELDRLPFPDRRASPYRRYNSVLSGRAPLALMITSRGCPFNCIFCHNFNRRFRSHSAEYVGDEFAELARMGVKEVFIHDDTFTLLRDRVEKICRRLIRDRHRFSWIARSRLDGVDEELLGLMRRAGCRMLTFGVESGSVPVLKRINKQVDPEQAERVFAWCRGKRIHTLADFMVGNLGESREEVEDTFRLLGKLDPDFVQFSICTAYPGTTLYRLGRERGFITGDPWREFARNPLGAFVPPIWTEHFTLCELKQLRQSAYRAFYFRPRFLWRQVKRLRSVKQLFLMLGGARDFWRAG